MAGPHGVPAQQAAAWFAWHGAGRALLPRLRIAFVALAGLAPLHHERLVARGGTFGAVDRHVYYETSSYGPRAIDATLRVVGVDALVPGSDLPYAAPTTDHRPRAGRGLRARRPDHQPAPPEARRHPMTIAPSPAAPAAGAGQRAADDQPALPGRTLTKRERELRELAARPDRWARYVRHDGDGRHDVCLYRDADIDVWLLGWNLVDDTGWHDHDTSAGAVAVIRGAVTESRPRLGGTPSTRTVAAGRDFAFGPDHIHRMGGAVDGSVSIHAYSPPLRRMGRYSISEHDVMRRFSVSYADELRPLDD